ncbi:MAG: LysR family transcriptional regulator [Saccharospirillum sp.]|nr:LysR family transcriptional regulator [Saccharospirillum sp.]
MDKLRLLEMFLATCDGGSFAAAAKSCGTDPSTVSKAISRLEAQGESAHHTWAEQWAPLIRF